MALFGQLVHEDRHLRMAGEPLQARFENQLRRFALPMAMQLLGNLRIQRDPCRCLRVLLLKAFHVTHQRIAGGR